MAQKLFPTNYDELTALARALKLLIVDETEPLDEDKLKWIYLESLLKNGPYASKVSSVTASAAVNLENSDPIFIEIDPNGADRDVNLPAAGQDNHPYYVRHVGSANILIIKLDGGTEVGRLNPGQISKLVPSSAQDFIAVKSPSNLSTRIEGLDLVWNSATSISVGTGHCYAENGDEIELTSAIAKSGLSLTGSTWYHVYVYLSGGAPLVDVATTAPAAWKNGAYSKTGDTARRYVGSIRTDGSGNVLNFLMQGTHVTWRIDTLTYLRVLTSGTATTATAVDCSSVVPVTARQCFLRTYNGVTSPTNATMWTGVSDGSITPPTSGITVTAYNGGSTTILHPLNSSRAVTYAFGPGTPSAGGGFIDIFGYVFSR